MKRDRNCERSMGNQGRSLGCRIIPNGAPKNTEPAGGTGRPFIRIAGNAALPQTEVKTPPPGAPVADRPRLAKGDRNLVWLSSIGQNRTIRQPGRSRPPLRLNFPLWVGKSWSDSYRALDETLTAFRQFANLYVVEAVETIPISSQKILTFRIRRIRKNVASGESVEDYTWYAPAVRNVVQIQNKWPGGTNLILTGFKPSSNSP